MTTAAIDIEAQGDHQYVVRMRDGDEQCESWFHFSPALLEQWELADRDEESTVRRTAEYLVDRQGVADFPDIVELEDVVATYDDYVEFIRR
jgi:hypothetical protein